MSYFGNESYATYFSDISYTLRKIERVWGSLPVNYKKTGLDYVQNEEFKKAILTIVNLENAQLIFIDSGKTKNTRVIKITS